MKTYIVAISLGLIVGSACSDSTTAGDEHELGADAAAQSGPDAGVSPTAPDAAPNGEVDAGGASATCPVPGPAIVSDIDETLTTSDLEWLWQMVAGDHDPAMRAGGPELLHAYAERGYFILYLTSRPADATLGGTGETARDATVRWLTEHGFPMDPEHTRVELSPSFVYGDTAAEFKGNVLLDMEAEGFSFEAAYGNATSDIAAYEAAGIAKEHTFIIGVNGGTGATVAIPGDGWEEHVADYVPTVAPACE